MITRMSELFVRTLRDDPADAELPSHKLLVRAGYIRRTAPGIYTWLPLGLKVLRKIEEIVRAEMDRIGAQEVLFPALLPSEPYVATNRWTEYGDNLFRLKDRRGTDMLLGPTHEEMFTLLVKDMYRSYKDLPLALYQIQTKYRDEARPRAGVLRGREFVMKDSYSFDVDDAGLDASYAKHREAYIRIFDQLGFDYAIVKADAGPMGGSKSEEFLAVSPNGEDTFVRSPGGFAANVEAVRFPVAEPVDCSSVPAAQVVDTPNVPTIDSLVELSNSLQPRSDREWAASDMLKSIVFMLSYPDGERVPLVVGLPGDREVDEKRLEAAVSPAEVEPFTAEDFEKYPQLVKGYIGPLRDGKQFLGEEAPAKVRYLVDPRVAEGSEWVSGANENERHAYHLVFGRDFTADGRIDVAEVREGDPSPDGSGPLTLARGIEMGHIFQLGRKYADALGLQVLDQNGKLVTVTMGSYGIGVSRAVAAIVEDTYDEKGLSWPRSIAPYDVMVLAAGKGDEVAKKAKEIAEQLAEEGFEVLLDDRKASPGVKFKDSELIGVPTSVVIGKLLAEGKAEIVPVDEAIEAVKKLAE